MIENGHRENSELDSFEQIKERQRIERQRAHEILGRRVRSTGERENIEAVEELVKYLEDENKEETEKR